MSNSVDHKTENKTEPHDEAYSTNNEPKMGENALDDIDHEAAYVEQYDDKEEEHWADSYGDDVEEPLSRGGIHIGTVKTGGVTPKPPPKNNP
ncbi:uncharacterized protein F4807DRAFT_441709 [Annulohypoxylon truncatum]|uniref:uncharacterized protein n=1 Tax=Annulohypoxylon truncatum TaxID=327061 RepID=UPI002008CD22|nr:uncharacterized protein F4807DRAFT_441709 [Annulohypoxylon truncatum]KAI1205862.1 hypothetical protein F4807DRAFT_441709 [Annulohypoxylon truncatum]